MFQMNDFYERYCSHERYSCHQTNIMPKSFALVAKIAALLLIAVTAVGLLIAVKWRLTTTTTVNHSVDTTMSSSSLPYACVSHPDLVTFVPGYGVPPSCWYSGYVHYEIAGQQVHTHYTLLTAERGQGLGDGGTP
jgi:hypothetical protein